MLTQAAPNSIELIALDKQKDGYSVPGFFPDVITLPFELCSFNVAVAAKKRLIWWMTTNEKGVSHYVVERSTNAEDFLPIGIIAAGKNSRSCHYTHIDSERHPNWKLYYRLKAIKDETTLGWSGIIAVNNNIASFINVEPTPVLSTLVLFHPPANSQCNLTILSHEGNPLLYGRLKTHSSSTHLDVSFLSAGKYFALFESGTEKQVIGFCKL